MDNKTPINKINVVIGNHCNRISCSAIHFTCPFCKRKASVFSGAVTSIFSATCDENGKLFLVDARDTITEVKQETVH
jgi:hypothetical protein